MAGSTSHATRGVWQFLGESIGANPTPIAYAEVYTALQTGAIDGQDNPLVASRLMKFYEVTNQFVLTSHVIGYDVMTVTTKIWDAMSPAQQAAFQAAAEKSMADYTAKFNAQEKEALDFSRRRARRSMRPTSPHSGPPRRRSTRRSTVRIGRRGALERINAL